MIKVIRDLPDNVSYEDILREIYIHIRFQKGIQQQKDERDKGKRIDLNEKKWIH